MSANLLTGVQVLPVGQTAKKSDSPKIVDQKIETKEIVDDDEKQVLLDEDTGKKPSSPKAVNQQVETNANESDTQVEDAAKTLAPVSGNEVLLNEDTAIKTKANDGDDENVSSTVNADSELVTSAMEEKSSAQPEDDAKIPAPGEFDEVVLNKDNAAKPITKVLDKEAETKSNEGDGEIVSPINPGDNELVILAKEEKSSVQPEDDEFILNKDTAEKPSTPKVVDQEVESKENKDEIKIINPIVSADEGLVVSSVEEKSSKGEDKPAIVKLDQVIPEDEKEMKAKEQPVVVDQETPLEATAPIGESVLTHIPEYNGLNVPDAVEKSQAKQVKLKKSLLRLKSTDL